MIVHRNYRQDMKWNTEAQECQVRDGMGKVSLIEKFNKYSILYYYTTTLLKENHWMKKGKELIQYFAPALSWCQLHQSELRGSPLDQCSKRCKRGSSTNPRVGNPQMRKIAIYALPTRQRYALPVVMKWSLSGPKVLSCTRFLCCLNGFT